MPNLKIAAAQVASIRGDIFANIQTHLQAIQAAADQHISVLIFPELSLMGYEPDLAAVLAVTSSDERLAPLVAAATRAAMTVVIGAPLKNSEAKPYLGAIVLGPGGSIRTYSKMHLGGTEPNYFSPGVEPFELLAGGENIGLAICADSSRPSHPQTYADNGCGIYAAGVFLNAEWHATDSPRLAQYAARHRMLVLMANHGASSGKLVSVGKSAIWMPDGKLLAEANGVESALVIATRANESWRGEVILI